MKNRIKLIVIATAMLTGGAGLAHSAQEAVPRAQGQMQTGGAMPQGQMMGQMGQGSMMSPEMRQGMAGMMQNCHQMMNRMSNEGRPVQPRR